MFRLVYEDGTVIDQAEMTRFLRFHPALAGVDGAWQGYVIDSQFEDRFLSPSGEVLYRIERVRKDERPATEEPDEEKQTYEDYVTDPANRRMRIASGEVDINDKLVSFFYLLGRNELALGKVEELMLMAEADDGDSMFTNGWLARWAQYQADRLRS